MRAPKNRPDPWCFEREKKKPVKKLKLEINGMLHHATIERGGRKRKYKRVMPASWLRLLAIFHRENEQYVPGMFRKCGRK